MTRLGQELEKFFVGYNDFPTNFTQEAHPRFNVFRRPEGSFEIQIACPGLEKHQVNVSLHKGTLSIKGEKVETAWEAIHRGFSGKAFTRTFKVDGDLEVAGAELKNGILRIVLQHSEATKPVQIKIA